MTGPLPRVGRPRALLCASTPPQFVELLRVARALKAEGRIDGVFWLQLLPHKLAEAIAICEEEGFSYFERTLGLPAPTVVGEAVAPAPPPATAPLPKVVAASRRADDDPRPSVAAVPFVTDAVSELRAAPLEFRLWARLAVALQHRARVRAFRVWLLLIEWFVRPLRPRVHEGRAGWRRLRLRPREVWREHVLPAVASAGGLALRTAETLGFRGLPSRLRPVALPLCVVALYLLDRYRLVVLVRSLNHSRRLRKAAQQDLRWTGPQLLIVAEDALYDYANLVERGWRRRIPTVVVPYTIATAAEPAEAILNDPGFEGYSVDAWPGRLVARLLPHWVHVHNGRAMLRYPWPLVLVYEFLRVAPRRPWVFNDGYSVALAAESDHMAELYRREGLSASYVVKTGAIYDDLAAAVISADAGARRELLSELGLAPKPNIVLCALPPRMELERRPGCEFRRYEEVVEAMLRPLLALPDTAVVVSLHPTLRAADLRYVEQWGVGVSSRAVADLIARCDLYVAVVSATIRTAIASGKPVVNFDLFRFGYRDYDSAPGVVTVVDSARYREVVRRFGEDPGFARSLSDAQCREAARWGFRDGRSTESLLGLFHHVIAHGTPRGYVPRRASAAVS